MCLQNHSGECSQLLASGQAARQEHLVLTENLDLIFFCFVLFRLISSNLQLLQNFSVTCICDILYDILLCLRRKEEELFSWEILDAIETAYTNGVSAGSTQRKVCDSDGEKY